MAQLNTVRYAEPDYWEARYQREPALFEWFFGHTALRRIIRTFISKKKPLLHIGCGTSNLQEGMARSGYTIVNTDISEVVIQQMQQRHSQYTNMTYRVSDCRDMPEFLDCSFGHVLDKGTMDALLCCKQGTHNVMRMLLEIYRVLQPGGSFLLITLGDPTRRLPLLCDPRLPWKVSLLLLPKISAANQAYVDGKPINDSTEPVEAQGPLEVVDADTILDLPPGVQFSNFFFAYVCKKQPLQLPQHQGQKAQLPNGWVAGSKELFSKLQKEMGLPEDLLDKGRRKRVMHVPAGSHGMPVAPYPSSTTSMNSGTSSPVSMAALQSACSGSVPPAAMGDLQCVLTALQLEQLRHHQTPSPAGEASALSADSQRDIPARPQSAPNLVAISEADDGPAAEAVAVAAAAAAAGAGGGSGPLLGVQAAAVQQSISAVPAGASAASAGCAGRAVGLYPSTGLPQSVPAPNALRESHLRAASVVGASAAGEAGTAAAAAGGSPALVPSSDVFGGGQSPQHRAASSCGPGSAGSSMPMLVHTLSSPARLSVATTSQQQLLAHAGGDQPSASTQVFNFAVPTAAYAAAAGSSVGEEGAVLESAVLDSSPLPPTGKAKTPVASTPTSPGSTSAHVTQDSQEPEAWPGLKLQQGQVLPQLQGQQAAGVSAATAAAAAAGMYPHPVAPRGARLPRLRRFSTEYGALSGSALQVQLEQLRLIQAQHSESADGLVLHDVAAGDSCSSSAAAAAAVAAAAWGTVRRPRDRRLSNISILSGLSIMSSTSIDESGEDLVCEGPCSTAGTAMCSSEPSCQLCSTAHGATTHELSMAGNSQGAHATPSSSQ